MAYQYWTISPSRRLDAPSPSTDLPTLLKNLAEKGVELWFEGERLRFRSNDQSAVDATTEELKQFEQQIVGYLREQASQQEARYPASMSQQAMWVLNQQAPLSSAYHLAACLRVMSPIDVNALRHAIHALSDRHAILRTTYDYVDDVLWQRVRGLDTPELKLHRASDLSEDELSATIKADYQRPFDLGQGPVWRTSLYTRGPYDHVLLVTGHHIAGDGWSSVILIDELFKLYSEASGGPDANLPRPTTDFSDYVAWQEQILKGAKGERLWKYWRNQLADPLTPLELPTDHPRPANQKFHGGSFPFIVGSELAQATNALAREERTTLFVVLLAAYQVLLNRLTGAGDIIVGFPALGRNQKRFLRVVGNFVNTLPLRGRLDEALTFRDFIAQIRAAVSDAVDAQEYPFSLLIQRLQPKRDPGRSPLFEVSFALHRFGKFRIIEELLFSGIYAENPVEVAGLKLKPYPLSQLEGAFDLALEIVERAGAFHCIFKYNTDLFKEATVERIATYFGKTLSVLIRTPNERISGPSLRAATPELFIPDPFGPEHAAGLYKTGDWARHVSNGVIECLRHDGQAKGREVRPQGASEEALSVIWREVLRTDQVGRFDNFFDLGGHSLLAAQVASRILQTFSLELPLRVVFENQTLESLGRWIDDALGTSNRRSSAPLVGKLQTPDGSSQKIQNAAVPSIAAIIGENDSALSFSQQRMWLIQSLDPQNTAYNMSGAIRLAGRLDVGALRKALDELVRRHENLRSTFPEAGGEAQQHIESWRPLDLDVIDLRPLGDDARSEATRRAEADARTPIDLACGPVMRLSLFRTADEEHVLCISLHHIAGDQWSFGIIVRELAAVYNALRRGRPVDLKPITLRYRDFASWQRRYLSDSHTKNQLSYWIEKLKDLPPLELPTDFPRPRIRGLNGAIYLASIPKALIGQLDELSRREGATLFMTMLAAFALQLFRLTGQDDFAVGAPIANRTQPDVEEMVGTFVNTLALRMDLSGRPSFRDLLARVRATALDAYARQDISFDKLVQEVERERDNSRAPLVQVMFNMLNAPFYGASFDELEWEPVVIDRGGAQFELSLSVDVQISNTIVFEYNTSLFGRETIERFAAQYFQILSSITKDPAQSIVSVPMLPESERRLVLHDFNATRTNDLDRPLFVGMFEQQVAQCPDAPAVSFEGKTISYGMLDARANAVARKLSALGIRTGAGVALCTKRSIDLVVVLLGIQKSGAYYVPLDPSFPAKRLAYMLADSGVSLVITDAESSEHLTPPAGVRMLDCAELMAATTVASGPNNPIVRCLSSDIAYIIYTSGSTGQPKGVAVQHRSLSNFLMSMSRNPGLKREDVLAAVTTISFDIAALELYLPLSVGARIELVSRETASDAALLSRLLAESRATVLQATPVTWRMLIDGGWGGSKTLRAFCGGETLSRDLADTLLERVAELWNLYGPTETTIWSTVMRVEPDQTPVPIGRPIENTQIYIVDNAGALLPVGVPGEILIAGEGVAMGYRDRPELTAERFAPDRFLSDGDARLYRTGDLGKWGADGLLYHLGRIDSQVKVRGFRIETGEIETILRQHPSILHAVVVARELSPGDSRLIAYIVNVGEGATVSELRNHLRDHVPDYMIPSLVVTIDEIPLTPNGKVDRKALPDPFSNYEARLAAQYEAPAAGMEEIIAGIWRDLLKAKDVSANDNFFELGGHSLLAIKAAALVRNRTGKRLDPRTLYFQNLRQIAEVVLRSEV